MRTVSSHAQGEVDESRESCGRRRLFGVLLLVALVPACLDLGACASLSPTGSSVASSAVSAPTTDTQTSGSNAYVSVFVDLARAVAPMPIYGLEELPAGTAIPEEWWPVLEVQSPAAYYGPATANPRVLGGGDGFDPEVQLLLGYGDGWLLIVENFRGDLGDVTGTEVGWVREGAAATMYDVNGGTLVQWSDGGRWYGVFGRDVPREDVAKIALRMKVVPPEE
jgi:hypothetical protein